MGTPQLKPGFPLNRKRSHREELMDRTHPWLKDIGLSVAKGMFRFELEHLINSTNCPFKQELV